MGHSRGPLPVILVLGQEFMEEDNPIDTLAPSQAGENQHLELGLGVDWNLV